MEAEIVTRNLNRGLAAKNIINYLRSCGYTINEIVIFTKLTSKEIFALACGYYWIATQQRYNSLVDLFCKTMLNGDKKIQEV